MAMLIFAFVFILITRIDTHIQIDTYWFARAARACVRVRMYTALTSPTYLPTASVCHKYEYGKLTTIHACNHPSNQSISQPTQPPTNQGRQVGWLAGWPRPRRPCFRKSMNMPMHLNMIWYSMMCCDMCRYNHEYEYEHEYE